MARPKKGEIDLGSSALFLSRFDEDYEAAEKKAREEIEAKLQEAKNRRLEQKKKFEDLRLKYKESYDALIIEFAPKILKGLGLEIIDDLTSAIKDQEKIELLNKAGNFSVLFDKDRKLLAALTDFLSERKDICQGFRDFLDKHG